MGRRKQVRPHRSVGILERRDFDAESSRQNGGLVEEKEDVVVDIPFFVEVDRSSWDSNEHFDISEIILLNLKVAEEFYGCRLNSEFYANSRYFLRFKLSNVSEYLDRIKLGHWPVLAASSICLQFMEKHMVEGVERDDVIVSGNFDGPEEGVSGLVHLVSLKFLTLRPIMGFMISEDMSSIRVRVEIQKGAFEACESLLDKTRPLWKKSMMSVMDWQRPEVLTSETRYRCRIAAEMDIDSPKGVNDNASASKKQARFDVASFYESIKPSKQESLLEDHLPDLLPELRPYQRRAAYWMIQREKRASEAIGQVNRNEFVSPLSVPVTFLDTSSQMYYNPFSGNISLQAEHTLLDVPGGILADEMGLGKTVELLACIFAHQMSSTEVGKSVTDVLGQQGNNMRRLKKERIECICGAVSESPKYRCIWVQCDICDAWQHADCVGYSAKWKVSNSSKVSEEEENKKKRKRKNNVEIVMTDGMHICKLCSELIQATESAVATSATLIVCPTPILAQWHSEIIRHTNVGSLRTCIYEGVRNASLFEQPVTDMNELLSADIVLTTYEVLKEDLSHDSDRHEGDRRFMRFKKRYPVIPTPLTRVFWWRLCLDEAQMVESNAAAATEMALRLHAKHRWCITGTPIQQKLDDLYGLLKFLKASPFDSFRWWTEVIRIPYEREDEGAMIFTHKLFKQLMWRSSKVHVAEELQLPPQEECVSWLSLSPIEEHFYQRQHETCVNDALDVINRFKKDILERETTDSKPSDALPDAIITNVQAAKLFHSLLKLRQACCHPQVGSSGLRSLQQSPLTMEEILSVLIGKTKVEGEEALRKLVVALNALAGIAIIKQDYPQAVSFYIESMSLAEEHSEDFRLDPLLNIHLHHNLAEVLPLAPDNLQEFQTFPRSFKGEVSETIDVEESDQHAVKSENVIEEDSCLTDSPDNAPELLSNSVANGCSDNSSDSKPHKSMKFESEQFLRKACEDLKQKFLSVFNSKLSVAQQDFRKSYGQVCKAFSDRKNQHTTWWLEALHLIEQKKDLSGELTRKIGEAVSTLNTSQTSRIASCFHSITALKYYIQTGLDALKESRKTLLDRLLEIDQTMGNPREEDIERVRFCPNCQNHDDGLLCVHCELDELFQVYEARLFRLHKGHNGEVITSAQEAINMQKRKSELNRFYRALSKPEKNSNFPTSHSENSGHKRDFGEKVMVSKSPSELEVVLGIIKSNSRGLLEREGSSAATKQLLLLEAMRKEYAQARSLAIAQAQVLRAHDEIKMATSRLHLKEDETDTSISALSSGELDVASTEYSSDKFLALSMLSRIKGQLRYLKGLAQSKQKLQQGSDINSASAEGNVVSVASPKEKEHEFPPKPDEETCPICHEKLGNQKMVFQCGHVTCCKCLLAMSEQRVSHPAKCQNNWIMCPTCRQHTNYGNIAFVDDRRIDSHNPSSQTHENTEASITVQGSYSTKIEAVTRRILWINSTNPTAKVLVFTSWNDVLDVLEHAFAANNISYIRMKGGRKSHVAVSHFRGENSTTKQSTRRKDAQLGAKSIQVLLLLIQHGANGLNLLEAQHVILVEPLLNPAAEAQAIGRVHRIGQQNKTLVHRFIVEDTVEESIHKMNKSRCADSFISGNRKNQDQPVLTLRDVESLFRVEHTVATEQKPTGSLMHLPPSVAAAVAAERRLMESTT